MTLQIITCFRENSTGNNNTLDEDEEDQVTKVEVDNDAAEGSENTPPEETVDENDEETLPPIVTEGKDFRIEIPDRV